MGLIHYNRYNIMATTTKKSTKKSTKTSTAKKVNTSLLNASLSAINTTLDNGEKWQKLATKLIKKSEKLREQQINMIFDTAETVKGQFITGSDKMKDLVGYDATVVENAKQKALNHPVAKKVVSIVEDISEKVAENPTIQKAEKATEELKNMGVAKFNELKGDVLKQASKIVNTAELKLEDARKELKKEAKKASKKAAPKTVVAKKATATKAKATTVVSKAAPKKVVAKAAPKKAVAKKATVTKAKATKAVSKAAPKKVVAKAAPKKAAPKKKVTPAKKV